MKRSLLTTLLGAFIATGAFAQNVTIPDANFKAYLVADPNINTNSDGEIQVSEAAAFTTSINCNFLNISDFTGIEAFVNLHSLTIVYNPVTTLDLSQNTALTVLDIYNNNLTSLDVSNNTALVELRCENNPIGSLDVGNLPVLDMLTCGNCALTSLDVTNNPMLSTLDLGNYTSFNPNQLTSIDLSNNTDLATFGIAGNLLTAIDVSNNDALSWFSCHYNNITSLNISNLTGLITLYAGRNQYTAIDLTNNTNLESIDISMNPLVGTIDISNHTAIRSIICNSTNISGLNVANGHNSEFTAMYAYENPNLTCIEVDDEVWSTTNWNQWTSKDSLAVYSEDCGGLGIEENKWIISMYPNPASSQLTIEAAQPVLISLLNATGANMKTLAVQAGVNSVSVQDLKPGLYFILDEKGNQSRFIKQ